MSKPANDVTPQMVAAALAKRLAHKAKIKTSKILGAEIRVLMHGDLAPTIQIFDTKGMGEVIQNLTKVLLNGDSIKTRGFSYWLDISTLPGDGSGHMQWDKNGRRVRRAVYICIKRGGRLHRLLGGYFWGKDED